MAIVVVIAAVLLLPQEIPKGVRYHRADSKINAAATAKLKAVLSSKPQDADFSRLSAKVVICGPGLWNGIKKAIGSSDVETKSLDLMVPYSGGVQKLAARRFINEDAKEYLWIAIMLAAQSPTKPTIRKAKANEIKYLWSMIPYDLDEPLLVAVTGKKKLLFHFEADTPKDPRVMWVDLLP